MANVDFTLEDVRKLIIDEREHTQKVIRESAEDVKQTIVGEFLSFWDNNLAPAFEEIHDEFGQVKDRVENRLQIVESDVREVKRDVKSLTRIVDRHSKVIMELRAREA